MSAPASSRTEEEKREWVVLLVGRPNSGKSSLFNAITGGDAKVGNFPGVTVDVLDATVELPGAGRRASLRRSRDRRGGAARWDVALAARRARPTY